MRKPPLNHFIENSDLEIVKAKTCDVQSQRDAASFYSNISDGLEQFSEGKRYQCDTSYSSSSLHSSRTLADETQLHNYIKRLGNFFKANKDPEIMSVQAKTIFLVTTQSPEEWLTNFTEKCLEVEVFFKDSDFNRLVETAYNSDDPKDKATLILTLDYFTNLTTFTFFLLWKWIHNENSQDMSNFVAGQGTINEFFVQLLSLRINEFRIDFSLTSIIEQIVQPFPDKNILRECSQNQRPLVCLNYNKKSNFIQGNGVLPWSTSEVAQLLSIINQSFYADLQIRNIIVKGGLNNYFRRINTFSQFIIYSVVRSPRKHDRQDALAYWIDLAEKLQENFDLEGLFLVYKYGIQLLLKDYIGTMPISFRDQKRIPKINSFYEQHIKENFSDIIGNTQSFCIPSFHKYITQIRRLEQQAKHTTIEQISDILQQLIKISKHQSFLHSQMSSKVIYPLKQITTQQEEIIAFLTKGIESELEKSLRIPLEKETLVYIQLIKMAKSTI